MPSSALPAATRRSPGARGSPSTACCAIDFGTSNSGVAVVTAEDARLIELEAAFTTMPTAVFYAADGHPAEPPRMHFGRAAVAAYVDGLDGRLMRSMKSILGSSLVEQTTDIGAGRSVRYLDVVAAYLAHLKARAEASAGAPLTRVVLGRPVYFVDDDAAADAKAEAALRAAARRAGFVEIEFQFEPIAAAFDYEQGTRREEKVLVADIGGGTSDFSLVRVGPARAARAERKDDILANHGVHVAGTDFDRRVELARILPLFGYGSLGRSSSATALPRQVPSAVYFDLATWHLINTVYNPQRAHELARMRSFYADPAQHRRLLEVVTRRLGHDLLGRAEAAKIAVAGGGTTRIDLGHVEAGLGAAVSEDDSRSALAGDLERIVAAAEETVRRAGLAASDLDALYFTGGSTGLTLLSDRLRARFPAARAVHGDRFASVVAGLGVHARRQFAV